MSSTLPVSGVIPVKFVQNAGIGDAVIYLNSLKLISRYFPDFLFKFYVRQPYVPLLEGGRGNIEILNIDNYDGGGINFSPHSILGGESFFLRRASIQYFIRASIRYFSIYLFNEYAIAKDFEFHYFKRYFRINYLSSVAVGEYKILIAPFTSDVNKNIDLESIKRIIVYCGKTFKSVSFIIVAPSDLFIDEGLRINYVWFDRAEEYLSVNVDFAICADSWLLHFLFNNSNKPVLLYSKDDQHMTFSPCLPIVDSSYFV